MADEELLYTKLLELLKNTNLDQRYYNYYKIHASREQQSMPNATRETLEAVLQDTGLSFSYNKREKFFHHKETHEHCDIVFNIAFPYSTVEFILAIKTAPGYIGEPFPVLAHDIGQLRDASFAPKPPYPKLPFSNLEELRETVQFGVTLYKDAQQAILSYAGWDA